MNSLREVIKAYLKKIFSDLHSAILGIILSAIILSVSGIYLFCKKLWLYLKTTMQSPTPLWATTILVLLVIFYRKQLNLSSSLKWLYSTLKATKPVSRNLKSGDLVLHRAVYGVHGEGIDVTSSLASQMLDGQLKVIVGNNLGGDPCPGQPKELRVDFSYQGQEHHRIVPEGETLSLP